MTDSKDTSILQITVIVLVAVGFKDSFRTQKIAFQITVLVLVAVGF